MASFKTIWADPVWSKVIAGAILAMASIAISYFLNWWPAIGSTTSNVYGFLAASSLVANWLIGIGAICSLIVAYVLGAIIWQIVFPSTASVTKSWRSYVTDNFFHLRWHWQYGSDGDIYNLYACCEECDYQIHPENISDYAVAPQIAFRCDLCARVAGPFDEEQFQFESKVRRLIQQKLRTGTWVNATP